MSDASFAAFDRRARDGGPLSVVFFGGSLTWGAFSSDPQRTSYRALTADYLRRRYPKASFAFHDAAIGGIGSKLGLFRLERDVLSRDPDLVFLDFAANDGLEGDDPRSLASYEALLRGIVGRGIPVLLAFFCFRHHLEPCDFAKLAGYRARKELARAYGTAEGDALLFLQEKIASGETSPDLLWDASDPCHPDDPGYRMFFEAVRLGFERAVAERRTGAVPASPVDPGAVRPVERRLLAGGPLPIGWTRAKTYRTSLWFDGLSSRWMGDVARCDARDRDKIEPLRLPFRGTFLGLIGEADEHGLGFRATVDGQPLLPVDAAAEGVWDFTPPGRLPGRLFVWRVLSETLPPGEHLLELIPHFPEGAAPGQLRIESLCAAGE
ncbi:MAG TPA: SGNH/GDSL hydrolase family protein [Candidatus Methylacidiphilales bacterium]